MFKVHQANSQKYLNEKDKLFGLISWKDFTTRFMAPLILGGAYSNLTENNLFTFFYVAGLVGAFSFLFEIFCSKNIQYKLISTVLHPKTVSVSLRELRQWKKYDN